MFVNRSDYEELLSEYSNPQGVIALFKQYRPYLEKLPSLRRPDDSIITIPLPIARVRQFKSGSNYEKTSLEPIRLPCELVILMCDPDWKIKLGAEVLVFIHRPNEELSDLLGRWRQIQVFFDQYYEWLMPNYAQHMLSEGSDKIYPLFVLFSETPERIKRGLSGASLPFVINKGKNDTEENLTESFSSSPNSP